MRDKRKLTTEILDILDKHGYELVEIRLDQESNYGIDISAMPKDHSDDKMGMTEPTTEDVDTLGY